MAEAWDEQGNVITQPEQSGPQAWDEHGNPITTAATNTGERSVLQRAGEEAAGTFFGGIEAGKRLVVPPSKEEATKYLGPSGMWRSFKETGAGLLAPLTSTVGALVAAPESLAASGLSYGVTRDPLTGEKIAPGSEAAYEVARPYVEAATEALAPGRARGAVGPASKIRVAPARGPEGEAGQVIAQSATDLPAAREALETVPREIVPGSEPTTYQLTNDPGLGQLERASRTRDYAPHQQRFEEQNAARMRAFEQVQATGSPQEVADHLRGLMRAEEANADSFVAYAQQRALEASQRLGGTYDPATYGNVLREELQRAETAARTNERALWRRVNPDGTLRANPQPIQQLERSIYGNLTEAATASLTPAESRIAGLIQQYRPNMPFRELTDLRSLVSTAMREERIARGQTATLGRLTQLRQGVEDALARSVFDEAGAPSTTAAERVREASAATRERAERFGPMRAVTRREGAAGPYRMGESAVADRVVQPGAKGYDSASNYLRAVGNEKGLPVLQDAVAASMRRNAIGTDGVVNPSKLESWTRRHQDVLRAIDERDGGAFSQSLRDAGRAQEISADAMARREAVAERYSKDELGRLVGAVDDADIARTIGSIFGRVDSVARARELASRLTTPTAREGARRAIVEYMRNKLLSNAPAGEDVLLRAEQFQNFVRANKPALSQFMTPEQIKSLDNIALDLRRTNRSVQTKMRGSSNTAQDLYNMERQGMLSRLGSFAVRHALGHIPIVGRFAKVADAAFTNLMRERNVTNIQSLIDRAMLEPDFAAELLKKSAITKPRGAIARGAAATTAAGAASEETKRQAGGTVKLRVDRTHDVPYLAGARKDGKAIYIDRRLPRTLKVGSKTIDPAKYLAVHEENEWRAMQRGMSYEEAHRKVATPAERAAVEKDGVDWNEYERELDGYIRETERERVKKSPQGLYLKPYSMRVQQALRTHASDGKRADGGKVKRTQASVHYKDNRGTLPRHCGNCSMFIKPRGCTDVEGRILPMGKCDIWAGKKKFQEGGAVGTFDTELTPQGEIDFQKWKQVNAPHDSGADYDLRGAYQAGFSPDPETGHWPDTFKKPNHPTFSDQSIYAAARPEMAGTWRGDQYLPPHIRAAAEQPTTPPPSWPDEAGGFEAAAARVRRRYPVREPSPEQRAMSQVTWEQFLPSEERARAAAAALQRGEDYDPRDVFLSSIGLVGAPAVGLTREAATLGAGAVRRGAKALEEVPYVKARSEFGQLPGEGGGVQPPGGSGSGTVSLEEAQGAAARASGQRQPLEGLPNKPLPLPEGYYVPGPNDLIHRVAEDYMRGADLPYNPPRTYANVEPERAARIAQAFEEMPHNPSDPRVRASYDAMIKETIAQFRALEKTGLKIEFIKPGMPDPYEASPRLANKDMRDNNHLWVFPTDTGFGTGPDALAKVAGNPLLRPTGIIVDGRDMLANDVFRIVHDYFGHFKDGNGFRAAGEENAWRSHSAMYSDLARGAMTTETRGQNSWLNFGPHGEANRTAKSADTVFADQKVGLLPDWVINEGRGDLASTATPYHELKPGTKEWQDAPHPNAPFPQYATEYPPVGPPTMKQKTKKLPSGEVVPVPGKTYPEKTLTPEAEAFRKKREKIRAQMKEEGYDPYFDPKERFNVDPSKYPERVVETLGIQPKKQETLADYLKVINAPETRALLREAYKKGLTLGDTQAWYAVGQLERSYIKALGPAAGRAAFLDEFAVPMAATTSGNKPMANFLMAHFFEFLRKRNLPIPVGHQFPVPIGGRRVAMNIRDYKAMRKREGYSGFTEEQPKMHNFTRSFIGDLDRAVMDEQMAGGMLKHYKKDPEFADRARKQAFGLLEKPVHQEAKARGVRPGEYQDVAWAGFKNEAGGPMISQINESIELTHRLTGMPRSEIVRQGIIGKKIPLYMAASLLGTKALGELFGEPATEE